jgi:hypothetical protein
MCERVNALVNVYECGHGKMPARRKLFLYNQKHFVLLQQLTHCLIQKPNT